MGLVLPFPSVVTFFHVSLYFAIVTIKLCLDLLVAIPLGLDDNNEHGILDESLINSVERLVATVRFVGRLVSRVASSRRLSSIATCLSLLVLPSPAKGRFCSWKNVGCFWLVARRLTRGSLSLRRRKGKVAANVDDRLWRFLSSYIKWTRTVTQRHKSWCCSVVGVVAERNSKSRGTVLIVLGIAVAIFLSFGKPWLEWPSPSGPPAVATRRGFTARIPSCYDGDTCRLRDIEHDGRRLPDLFQKLSVRIRGIDAPEVGARAGCYLEACLAVRAREKLESIVGIDERSSPRVSLVDCGFDKYGGRIVCDVFIDNDARKVDSVASEMLQSGLAVPYDGKRKWHADSWCDPDRLTAEEVLECD